MTHHIVALSGGKDSTAMSLRLAELNPETDYQFVITPTGDELPDMFAHWRTLEERLGKNLTVVNTKSLADLIREQGMIPNFRARFCTRMLKIEPFIDYVRSLDGEVVWYVGLRADENTRLGVAISAANIRMATPMRDWGWGLQDVLDYLDSRCVTVPRRTDCGACFYQRLIEWYELWRDHPDRYESYVKIEDEIGHTFRSDGRDSQPAGLRQLRDRFENGYKPKETRRPNSQIALFPMDARVEDFKACQWCSR